MNRWRQIEQTWCNWPSRPRGLVEMIGGSYLATNPQISYRRLLEGLSEHNLAIHAWGYVPGFDHQSQANEAWKSFRRCRERLETRVGLLPPSLRLGHSLGCKLHLLAPDGGRKSKALVALSFNNFAAIKSVPMLAKLAPKLGIQTEFSPSPYETLRLIQEHYIQPKNLLISFTKDKLDQSSDLICCLQRRKEDKTQRLQLDGDHLTPASAGLRQHFLGEWAYEDSKTEGLRKVIDAINHCTK